MRINTPKKIRLTLVTSFVTSVFVFLCLRFFILDLAQVNSLTMSETLQPGQWVFIRPVCFLNSKINRNEIVQVYYPFSEPDTVTDRALFFKRIIGMPGDSLYIRRSEVYINQKPEERHINRLHNYIIHLQKERDTLLFTDLGITEKYLIDDSCVYLITLTKNKFELLRDKGFQLKENGQDSALYDEKIFPWNPLIKWNKDFFGPVCVPKKLDTLYLDTTRLCLYKHIIRQELHQDPEIILGKIYINHQETNYYIPKEDYYFVMGDNTDNSMDSRHWGFVPKSALASTYFTLKEK